ncbi:hypothetical protein KIN20_034494 [Parelaphostrongylus tenuis]|uniref:Uncharacterized protein n=1 Tax=Parelaphostrongylus tenuis TaxID=148309 RepID=A0AAD5RAF6_PARTN|nr:hypothetical protein KIN20_034494 [Parelaphostrongylus tenuis]
MRAQQKQAETSIVGRGSPPHWRSEASGQKAFRRHHERGAEKMALTMAKLRNTRVCYSVAWD